MKNKKLIVITGPTASGKSALAVSLARSLDTEIISADSRQIYKDIPIVTAVPSEEEKKGIKHHLLEILDLEEYYSAARFQEDADIIISKIFRDKDYAIVCGGSMMYIDALVNGIDNLPTVSQGVRESLMKEWETKGNKWLLEYLRLIDPTYFWNADLNNLKRVFHAVEIYRMSGKPYSSFLTFKDNGKCLRLNNSFKVLKFCLNGDRDKLFERINSRVEKMMISGLEEEALRVYPLRHLNSLNTVGLKEMFSYFEGNLNREEAISRIKKNTRVYAKKQLTWHKRDNKINYIDFADTEKNKVNKILTLLS